MTIAVPAAAFTRERVDWRRSLFLLALAAVALLALFRRDAADMAHIWWTSTTFGHCLFITPVVAWLVWQRRAALAELEPVGWLPGLALVAAGGFGWLLGDAGGVAFARQVGLVVMLQGAVLSVLGPNVARGLLFPLGYALFLVPFGEWLEPPLQTVTVAMTMPLLHMAGVPAHVDGVLITIPNGFFEVAEACSGAKFVIAMIAYGALVAHVGFRDWRRRAAFMLVSLVVPVFANGVRAFGTIYAAHLTSVEAATGFDHIVYGWLFFAAVMAAVLALGWRWFDRTPDDPPFDPTKLRRPVRWRIDALPAAVLTVATAALFLAWSAAADARSTPLAARLDLPQVAGWHRVPLDGNAPWTPYYPSADHFLVGRYADPRGATVDVAVAVFASQHEGHELVAFGTGVLRQEDVWVRVADEAPLLGGSVMRITAPGPVERLVATWYRLAGMTTADETRVKLETMRVRLLGGDQRAVAVHLSAEGRGARAAMTRLAVAIGSPGAFADRISGARP